MFGTQKNSSTNEEEKKNSQNLNLNQKKDLNIEDSPIHTMQEDLEKIKNPNAPQKITPIEDKKITITQKNPIQKPNTSPFLSGKIDTPKKNYLPKESEKDELIIIDEKPKTTEKPKTPMPEKTPEQQLPERKITPTFSTPMPIKKPGEIEFSSANENKKSAPITPAPKPLPKISTPTVKINWQLIFVIAISFALIALAILAGYSYYLKATTVSVKPTEPTVEIPEEKIPEKPAQTFSQTNPNYFHLEETDTDAQKIKTRLLEYAQKVEKEGYTAPVEFLMTDAQNAPIGFQKFANLLEIKLSASTLTALADNFSLFIYNDISAPKIGLAIDSKDDIKLAKSLLQEEKNLADEISPIFFTSDYKKDKPFGSSEYSGAKIRYQNIISPDNLSVDYTIYGSKLLIGTTKTTLRSIIDKINAITIK